MLQAATALHGIRLYVQAGDSCCSPMTLCVARSAAGEHLRLLILRGGEEMHVSYEVRPALLPLHVCLLPHARTRHLLPLLQPFILSETVPEMSYTQRIPARYLAQ